MFAEGQAPLTDADRRLALGGDAGAPAALYRVELQQMRDRRRPTLDLVEVHHLQPVAGARILGRPVRPPEGRTQGKTADPAHSVDSDPHRYRTMA